MAPLLGSCHFARACNSRNVSLQRAMLQHMIRRSVVACQPYIGSAHCFKRQCSSSSHHVQKMEPGTFSRSLLHLQRTSRDLLRKCYNDPMLSVFHAGNLLIFSGHAMTDMLHLRTLALVGNSATMAYFLSRKELDWNLIGNCLCWLALNTVMLVKLLRDTLGTLSVTEEEEALFEQQFAGSGITIRQVLKLLAAAVRTELPEGTDLRRPGQHYADLVLIASGGALVRWEIDGRESYVGAGWIGEMGYLERTGHDDGSTSTAESRPASTKVATVGKRSVVYVWNDHVLQEVLATDTVLQQRLLALLANVTRSRVTVREREAAKVSEHVAMLRMVLLDGRVSSSGRAAVEAFRCQHDISDDEHRLALERIGWTEEDYHRGAQNDTLVADVQRLLSLQGLGTSNVDNGSAPLPFNGYSQAYGELASYFPVSCRDDSGKLWRSVEHYYQAQKFASPELQEEVRGTKTPFAAHQLGRSLARPLRPDWDDVREDVLLRATRWKFEQNDHCREILLGTGDRRLILNDSTDAFWGCGADGHGLNRLGVVLEKVRSELRQWSKVDSLYQVHCKGSGLTPQQFFRLLSSAQILELGVGEALRTPGEQYLNLLLVTQGQMRVRWEKDHVDVLTGAGWVGEMGYLTRERWKDLERDALGQKHQPAICTTNVVATTPVLVHAWTDQALSEIFSADPTLRKHLLTMLAECALGRMAG